ncbi:MAG: hypothetical protein KC877_04060 [Candidatus Kaiserbacteria bacterium]|nr:hypothetical protein [Candidatus Kaiserbacteria bacterium]MCB9816347.1 hypothetical protein [Candidatus Nomurabacteria bacterium]
MKLRKLIISVGAIGLIAMAAGCKEKTLKPGDWACRVTSGTAKVNSWYYTGGDHAQVSEGMKFDGGSYMVTRTAPGQVKFTTGHGNSWECNLLK